MLVLTVAGIDDGAGDFLCQESGGTGRGMAHHQHIRVHGVQRHRRIDQRFALFHRGIADRHVHDVGAKPLAGELKRRLRTRRGFEEEVDLRQPPQRRGLFLSLTGDLDGFIGAIEQIGDILLREPLDAEQVAMRESDHGPPLRSGNVVAL
ncbi:hypothetical protein D9M70_502620 [compost metagenome]